ncbi:putative nucleic-acid-binding Zn-ribbon protein [Clostridiales Family XIII bacterium PM5-7]
MKLNKWNYETHAYDEFIVPDDWNVKTYSTDMNEIIHCPQCGNTLTFGKGYTSREIQTEYGMGYSVCEKCSNEEFNRDCKNRSI